MTCNKEYLEFKYVAQQVNRSKIIFDISTLSLQDSIPVHLFTFPHMIEFNTPITQVCKLRLT